MFSGGVYSFIYFLEFIKYLLEEIWFFKCRDGEIKFL